MHCYYQGTLQVTGGNMNDVERVAVAFIEKYAHIEESQKNSDILIVDFSDAGTVSEEDVRGFVAEAEKSGWNVNGTLSYYGDYEGFLVITDNIIEEISSEEMVIRNYLDTPSIKAEKELADKAVSMAGYLFLRLIFKKENYQETVTENIEWIAEELIKEKPAEILIRNLRQELQEGDYGNRIDVVSTQLKIYFGFNEAECEKITNRLLNWMSAKTEAGKI